MMSGASSRPHNRTVVFIGRTGSGKSTCANTLAGEFGLFKESDGSVSQTKKVDAKEVTLTWKTGQYNLKIVDTIGIGDTNLSADEVLKRLAEACYECRKGINAVYFVTGGRFTDEEADAWDILWQVLFGPEILQYTSIVRTHFLQFTNPTEVGKDTRLLKEQKGAASRIMPQVKHMMYVDNPPEQYGGVKIRRQSQEILLAHLALQRKRFKPPVLEEVEAKISAHVESQRASTERLDELQQQLEEACQEMEKLRIQNEIAEEERNKAESEARVV